jgi:hypothetical protein
MHTCAVSLIDLSEPAQNSFGCSSLDARTMVAFDADSVEYAACDL